MTLVYVAVLLALALSVWALRIQIYVARERRRGVYPAKGRATMNDVARLAQNGQLVLAVRAFREIHGVSAKVAKKAVEELRASSLTQD